MIQVLNSVDPQTGTQTVTKIAEWCNWVKLYIQVKGATSIRIAATQNELLADSGAVQNGLEITPAMDIVELTWRGPLWARGNGALATVDLQVLPLS